MTACSPLPAFLREAWMPLDLRCGSDRAARRLYERLGFVFSGLVPGEPFQCCALPAGWSRAASDVRHWYWVLDAHGRPRIGVQCAGSGRAAVAHAELLRRYAVALLPGTHGGAAAAVFGAISFRPGDCIPRLATRAPVRLLGEVPRLRPDASSADRSARFSAEERQLREARAWLDARAPRWRDPMAHWDGELPTAAQEGAHA